MKGYSVVNVLVRPECRGRRIFAGMISAAKAFAGLSGRLLIGHPNGAAEDSWRRAGMTFHDSLVPYLMVPGVAWRAAHIRHVDDPQRFREAITHLDELGRRSNRLKVRLSAERLQWRFSNHPVNKYRMRLVEFDGGETALITSRRLRFGVNLVVDHFVSHGVAGAGGLWPSVTFRPRCAASILDGAVRLPLRKAIPFFCTSYCGRFPAPDTSELGLSVTDFA